MRGIFKYDFATLVLRAFSRNLKKQTSSAMAKLSVAFHASLEKMLIDISFARTFWLAVS